MADSEALLWDAMRAGVTGHWVRIENLTEAGTPDVSFAFWCGTSYEGWIELKQLREWPKRETTKVDPGVTTDQVRWGALRSRAGGRWLLGPATRRLPAYRDWPVLIRQPDHRPIRGNSMSTSALTIITQNGSPIITLYRHWDGYPSGHGKKLAEFLTGFQITTGRVNLQGKWANGAGCLAAQLVAHFKKGCGDFCLLATTDPIGYEWSYVIEIPFGWRGPAEDLVIQVYAYGELSSSCSVGEFAEYLRELKP